MAESHAVSGFPQYGRNAEVKSLFSPSASPLVVTHNAIDLELADKGSEMVQLVVCGLLACPTCWLAVRFALVAEVLSSMMLHADVGRSN